MGPEREVAGVRCGFVLDHLSEYLDGELSIHDRSRIDDHLVGCDNCARFGGAFAQVVRAVRAAPLASQSTESRLRQDLRAMNLKSEGN